MVTDVFYIKLKSVLFKCNVNMIFAFTKTSCSCVYREGHPKTSVFKSGHWFHARG